MCQKMGYYARDCRSTLPKKPWKMLKEEEKSEAEDTPVIEEIIVLSEEDQPTINMVR